MSAAAILDEVTEELYAVHTKDTEAAAAARREYEERRGKVHQDDELWEAWSAAFVEWFVIERCGSAAPRSAAERRGESIERCGSAAPRSAAERRGESIERVADDDLPLAVRTYRELAAAGDPKADVVSALVTSQRSLFEVKAIAKGKVELLDLLGGAQFAVDEQRTLHGVEVGDVAELRLIGVAGEVRFGRTFIYHPKAARAAIVERARAMLAKGGTRRDVIDAVAQLRVTVTRYRHMPAARVYELGSRITG